MGLSVPWNMGLSSVPSFHVNLSVERFVYFNMFFFNYPLRGHLCPLPDSGLSVPSIYGVWGYFEVSISYLFIYMFSLCH